MNCPNCGLANPDGAKFCANCGTTLTQAEYIPPQQSYVPPQENYVPPQQSYSGTTASGRTTAQKVGLGCLVAVLLVFLFGLSCMRSCLRPRRYYRRAANAQTVAVHDARATRWEASLPRRPAESQS